MGSHKARRTSSRTLGVVLRRGSLSHRALRRRAEGKKRMQPGARRHEPMRARELEVPPVCAKPSHSKSLANFVANVHSQEFLQRKQVFFFLQLHSQNHSQSLMNKLQRLPLGKNIAYLIIIPDELV